MTTEKLYPRYLEERLAESLTDSPIVLVHGPRQCGKTTFTRVFGEPNGYSYLSFDDEVVRGAARTDPTDFVSKLPRHVILDEVQRVPAIFLPLKLVVDRDRVPGRFILTGSSNVLLLPRLADSLAGRMQILRLHPLAQCELGRRKSSFLRTLFSGAFTTRTMQRLGDDVQSRVTGGGYPAALARPHGSRRTAWYRDYLEALMQRDVRDLARISSLDVLPRLLALCAAQTSRLFNVSELSSPFQLSRPTIRDYLTLLERTFLIDTVPSWHTNRLSRLIKTPKLHLGDTGTAAALLGVGSSALAEDRALFGQLLESFVFQELKRLASWEAYPIAFFHLRDKDGVEVDIVLEGQAGRLAGVEVKAAATVTGSDFRGLRKLRASAGKRFAAGIVLYDGETCAPFGDGLFAVPIRLLWEAPEAGAHGDEHESPS